MTTRPRLTARDVDDLWFAVRADQQALGQSRLPAAVERILGEHLDAARAAWVPKVTLNGHPMTVAIESGRRLASERDDLIAQGVDPADLAVPLHPGEAS